MKRHPQAAGDEKTGLSLLTLSGQEERVSIMSVHNLDKLFHPQSVAVIGAGERAGSAGASIMKNLLTGGFSGEVYSVNPGHKKMWDRQAYPSVLDLKQKVDLAIISTSLEKVPGIIRECGQIGVGGAIITSADENETDCGKKELLPSIEKTAYDNGIRIIGPGCFGLFSSQSKLNAGIARQMSLSGKMAFISQSGSICSSILDLSIQEKIGFSYWVHLGSMPDVDFADLIDYFGGDANVSSIVMYAEHLSHFRKFMSAARAVSRIKPIAILKAGRSLAEGSHTTASIDNNSVYEAAFNRAGIVRVSTFEELFDCAELLAKQPRPSGAGLAILTHGGGPGIMAGDALADYGLRPATLSLETLGKLDQVLSPHWSHDNPIRMPGEVPHDRYRRVVRICMDAPEINGLLVMFCAQPYIDSAKIAKEIIDVLEEKPFPVITCCLGRDSLEEGRSILNQAGIPTFDSPERAIRAFMNLHRYSENRKLLLEIPRALPRKLEFDKEKGRVLIQKELNRNNFSLPEPSAKALLSAYGIPVNISRKTENESEAVAVQPMPPLIGLELFMGSKKDPDFGPVIVFGMGGRMRDILGNLSIELPPLNRLLARRLMEGTKAFQLLKGLRNPLPVNLTVLEGILIRLSQLVTDFPEIEELELNPLIASENGICVAHTHVFLKPTRIKAPLHLVISAYPNQYEAKKEINGLGELSIRPIRPEDAPLMVDLFESLSPQSVYYRFFSPLKKLPPNMLARLTQIDYDREMAIVAVQETGSSERMLGVARVILGKDQQSAEFAVLVGDLWHGKGIAAELLNRCLSIAKERKIRSVWGKVLAENTKMIALAKRLNFKVTRSSEWGEYELSQDLKPET